MLIFEVGNLNKADKENEILYYSELAEKFKLRKDKKDEPTKMQFRNDFISNDEALERILADIETDPYMEQAINYPEISVITPPMETSQNCGTKRQGSRSSSPINLRSNNKHAKTNTENSL